MEDLNTQAEIFEEIKTLCSNYKKDSKSRKTSEYLTKKLMSLENLWREFEDNHGGLTTMEDKTHKYFTDKIYEKTRELYNSTKTDILQLMLNNTVFEPLPKLELTGKEMSDKVQELLDEQECNFNALNHAMAKINMNETHENWELQEHLTSLKRKWEKIDNLHWKLLKQLKGSNEEYSSYYESIEMKYDTLTKAINGQLNTNIHFEKSAPSINVPEFSGNYHHWVTFKDLFLDVIDKNPTLTKAQKLQHLKGKLRGEAERLVQHLKITNENYDRCWAILTHRFDNDRLIFSSYLETMAQLPTIQNPNKHNLKTMHDVMVECLNGLSGVGIDTTASGPILVHFMAKKLDVQTYNRFIKEMQQPRAVPEIGEFIHFLENSFIAQEGTLPANDRKNQNFKPYAPKQEMKNFTRFSKPLAEFDPSKTYFTSYSNCPLCNGRHVLMQCDKFIDMNIRERNNTVAKLRLCKNCLYSHGNQKCNSFKTCKECNRPHHTLLHYAKMYNEPKVNLGQRSHHPELQPSTSSNNNAQNSHHLSHNDNEVLLTTVEVQVKNASGSFVTLRALLDQGSQVNLITENAAQLLKLSRKRFNAIISGIGSVSGECKGLLELECKSLYSEFTFKTDVMIIKQITNKLPNTTFDKTNWSHMEGLNLADKNYNLSRSVDLLLGADVYSQVILHGVVKGDPRAPVAQQTHLGWILCGKLRTFNCHVTLTNLQELTKFWETEDILIQKDDVSSDEWCENHYQQNTVRDSSGKYVVKMPMINNYVEKLGESRSIAVSQFLQLERKFHRQPKLAKMYKDFIQEYINLGHMKPSQNRNQQNFVPHHGVLREHSTTTKLRTVFNASQKTIGGCSLNDVMEKGPNLQKDIQALVIQWRSYKYVYTADVEKMYRCIELHEEQQPLLKIIWRSHPSQKLQEYQLCTVTYGTKCAPWLAMRTIKQLAIDESNEFPKAAAVLKNQCYVDDVITGENTIESAKQLQKSLIDLLKKGGMNLRKWCSNNPELLCNLTEDQISQHNIFDFKSEETTKTLGLRWSPRDDVFTFNWELEVNKEKITKRSLLSQISKLYDPLGWLSPITVLAKLLFQTVWLSKTGWDEELPNETKEKWIKLSNELQLIRNIKINRWLGSTNKTIQLLGFCDASEKAYACVIYSRVTDNNNETKLSLLAARTKVVPISHKTSLPKLELCGALLLSQLMEKIKKSLSEHITFTWAWCDSKVVLAWLQEGSKKWERYVANRVEKITSVIPSGHWCYIKSDANPADCASRGLLPSKTIEFNLWWNGPDFLKNLKENELLKNTNCLFTTNEAYVNKKETLENKQTIKSNTLFTTYLATKVH